MDNTMEVGKPVAGFVLTLVAGLLLTGAWAETKFVGYQERRVENIATDTTESESTYLRVAEGGELLKVGAGVWTLPQTVISQPWPFEVKVGEGTLNLTAGTTATLPENVAPDVLQKAQIWLEADDDSYFKTTTEHGSEAGKTYVDQWLDRRDDPASATRTYPYAKAFYKGTCAYGTFDTAPEVGSYEGKQAVYFGGNLSGRSMDLYFPGGEHFETVYNKNAATNYLQFGMGPQAAKTHSIFLVHGIKDCRAWFVGQKTSVGSGHFLNWNIYGVSCQKDTTQFKYSLLARSDTIGGATITSGVTTPSVQAWLDGAKTDFSVTGPTVGVSLYEVHSPVDAFDASTLMSERHGFLSATDIRDGGDYIYAYVAFANELTETERIQVREYLMRKYLPAKYAAATQTPCVTVAEGASVSFVSDITLEGDGMATKVGAGMATVRASSDRFPFAGELTLGEGSVTLQDDVLIRPTLGRKMTATEGMRGSGTVVSQEAGAAGEVEKAGAAGLSVHTIPEGTQKMKVSEGELVLAARRASGRAVMTSVPQEVSIANAGFETDTGWSYQNGTSGTHSYFSNYNIDWGFYQLPPEGARCVRLTKDCTMSQTVDIPAAGTYELSYWTRSRGEGGHAIDLFLEDATTGDVVPFGRPASPSSNSALAFTKVFFRAAVPKAGSYRLTFKSLTTEDFTTFIDDVKLAQVADDPEDEWKVPGGDFETVLYNHDNRPAAASWSPWRGAKWFNISNRVENWTFEAGAQCDDRQNFEASANLPSSGPVSLSMLQANGTSSFWYGYNGFGSGNTYLVNGDLRRTGMGQLLFTKNEASASATFTPPAGTWQPKFDMAYSYTASSGSSVEDRPGVQVFARVGEGAEQDLGFVYPEQGRLCGYKFSGVRAPKAFTADGSTPVTLRFQAKRVESGRRGPSLDNIVLSRRYQVVFSNPSADNGCSYREYTNTSARKTNVPYTWSLYVRDGKGYDVVTGTTGGAAGSQDGDAKWDGAQKVMIEGCGAMSQTVNFPKAGKYVLQLPCHRRNNAGNDGDISDTIAINLIRNGLTNTVGQVTTVAATFVRRQVLFDVPEAGDYIFELRGTVEQYRLLYIDNPVINYVAPAAMTAPSVPQTATFEVANGATLRLDYDGELKIDRYRYNGKSYHGTLSAANGTPGLAGSGALVTADHGLLILLR